MEFQLSCSKSWRWCCESVALNMPANLEISAVATGLEKVSFHSNPKERQCQRKFKLPHNYTHFIGEQSNAQNFPSQASTVHELPDVQDGLRKGRGTRDQIANIHWIIEKAREFKKKTQIYFCFFDYAKAFDYVSTINCGKFWKRCEYQTTWPVSWEICMHVKLEPDMEQ